MTLLTPWGESLDTENVLPEYPRPQLVRDSYLNLNGPWLYAVTPLDAATAAEPLAVADPSTPPTSWDGDIIVPFSPETPLSGVERALHPRETLWYRRTFTLPPALHDERVLLHFGAVDQSCEVAVNGVRVGGHTGGFLPFVLDVTEAIAQRGKTGEHEIVVSVRDVTDTSWLSRGKQARKRGGIWYSPQSGIWQTVWLEALPRVAVDALTLTPRLDERAVDVLVRSDNASEADAATVTIRSGSDVVATASVTPGESTRLVLDAEHGLRPWSPEDPYLYDVDVRLGDDSVTSYVGIRSFGVGADEGGTPRLLLNGRSYFHAGLLDQGYWSDGWLTAPSDAALEYDVQLAKDMGFTMLRKHIKIEPLRWYHHCDRLGILVWQDMVNGGRSYNPLITAAPAIGTGPISDHRHKAFGRADAAGRASYRDELTASVDHLRSITSIALWVPFNEAWGQFDALQIEKVLRELDDTRPIDHASGWHDQGGGDLKSLHVYFRAFRVKDSWLDGTRALALTEYGGYSQRVEGHCFNEREFGYRKYGTAAELEQAFVELHEQQIIPAVGRGLAASVYTQLSDVEDEVNGVVTYDRRVVKIPVDTVRGLNEQLTAGNTAAAEDAR